MKGAPYVLRCFVTLYADIRQLDSIPPYEYVCIPRPRFDYEAENRAAEEALDEDELHKKYGKDFEANWKLYLEPAKDHPEYTWVMMSEGYKTFTEFKRRSNYCCPDMFTMHIYNDFNGYGLQELIENQVR